MSFKYTCPCGALIENQIFKFCPLCTNPIPTSSSSSSTRLVQTKIGDTRKRKTRDDDDDTEPQQSVKKSCPATAPRTIKKPKSLTPPASKPVKKISSEPPTPAPSVKDTSSSQQNSPPISSPQNSVVIVATLLAEKKMLINPTAIQLYNDDPSINNKKDAVKIVNAARALYEDVSDPTVLQQLISATKSKILSHLRQTRKLKKDQFLAQLAVMIRDSPDTAKEDLIVRSIQKIHRSHSKPSDTSISYYSSLIHDTNSTVKTRTNNEDKTLEDQLKEKEAISKENPDQTSDSEE